MWLPWGDSVRQIAFISVVLASIAAVAQAPTAKPVAPSFRISGTVVNAISGEPVPRAEVQIGRSQGQKPLQSVLTPVDGRFRFEGLAPGKYWLSAQRRGFPQQAFEQHGAFFTAIAVGPNLDSENLIFRLQPHASISGTITDEAGEPVRDANVMLFRAGVESGRRGIAMRDQAQTDDRGMYHFSNVHPGTYYIAISARPWYVQSAPVPSMMVEKWDSPAAAKPKVNPALDVAYPITYYSGSTDANEATPITVKMGDRAMADVTLIAVPAVHLRIRVPEESTASSNAGAGRSGRIATTHIPQTVMLSQQIFGNYDSFVPTQQMQIASGEIEISGIPPGHFDMKVQSFGQAPISREGEVDVAGDAEVSSPAVPSQPITIIGKVALDGGSTIQQGFIRIWRRGSSDSLSGPIARGEFELHQDHIRPDKYEVGVFNVRGAVVRRIAADGAKVVGQSLEIQGGGTIRLGIELANGLGEISGTALRDGKPVSGAMIVLVPQDYENNTGLIRRDQSDSDGTFSLRSVLPGKYTVLALENGWDTEWLNPSVLSGYLPGGTPIEVVPREKYDIKVAAQ